MHNVAEYLITFWSSQSVLKRLILDQGGSSNYLIRISHREYRRPGIERWIERHTGRNRERIRDSRSFLVWDRRRDALLLGLLTKGKVSWLLLNFSDLEGFHKNLFHHCMRKLKRGCLKVIRTPTLVYPVAIQEWPAYTRMIGITKVLQNSNGIL